MTFEFVKLPELDFELESVTSDSGRVYQIPTGEKFPSITTVLSSYNKKALFEWRKRVGEEEANRIARQASSRGTRMHSVCEKYLLNELTDMKMSSMMPDTKELFLQLKPHLDGNIGKVYSIEQPLFSKELRVAGRVDCIAEWDNKLSVIDFKTSTKFKEEDNILNYFMQCTAYATMFEELTGKPINQLVVAIATNEGTPQIFVKEKTKYIVELFNFVNNYYLTNTASVP